MFRSGMLLTILVASLVGAFALYEASWFDPQPARTGNQVPTEAADSSRLSIVMHYRQGQPRHWRTCLLNH
jgi:hypothetical protein